MYIIIYIYIIMYIFCLCLVIMCDGNYFWELMFVTFCLIAADSEQERLHLEKQLKLLLQSDENRFGLVFFYLFFIFIVPQMYKD